MIEKEINDTEPIVRSKQTKQIIITIIRTNTFRIGRETEIEKGIAKPKVNMNFIEK